MGHALKVGGLSNKETQQPPTLKLMRVQSHIKVKDGHKLPQLAGALTERPLPWKRDEHDEANWPVTWGVGYCWSGSYIDIGNAVRNMASHLSCLDRAGSYSRINR